MRQSEGWDIGLKKIIKEHFAVRVFCVTAVLLFAISGLIYGMLAVGISKSYLMELDESIDQQVSELIPQLEGLTLGGADNLLDNFATEYGLSIMVKNSSGILMKSYGEVAYELAPDINPETIQDSSGITKTYSVEFQDGTTCQMAVFGTKQQADNVSLRSLERILPLLLCITVLTAFFGVLIYSMGYEANPENEHDLKENG